MTDDMLQDDPQSDRNNMLDDDGAAGDSSALEGSADDADNLIKPAPDLPQVSEAASPPNGSRRFEDLTLAEMLGQWLRSPGPTTRTMLAIAGTPTHVPSPSPLVEVAEPKRQNSATGKALLEVAGSSTQTVAGLGAMVRGNRLLMTLLLYLVAFFVALRGGFILISGEFRVEDQQLADGMPFLVAGFVLWLFAEFYRAWPTLELRFFASGPDVTPSTPPPTPPRVVNYDTSMPIGADGQRYSWLAVHPARVFAALAAVLLGVLTWLDTAAEPGQINQFKALGFGAWVGSIALVVIVFAPSRWLPANLWPGFRDWTRGIRFTWTFFALIAIMLVGLWFRVDNLAGVPPEMTSDHIEKLLDAQRVVDGDRDIFFANNGGREPFQMYALAALSQLPGLEMNFTLLKLLAVIESMLTLPLLWWMGRVVIGQYDPRLGNVVGLLLAALVAVSYWHVAMTRLSLRIVLTPLIASLLVIWLTRGIRTQQRGYYILAGLTLGFGLYTYQAVRMLPLVVVAGVGIAMLFHLRDRKALLRYVGHLMIVVLVSFTVFIPMFRYSLDYPEQFWMRTSGRLFGDSLIQVEDEETGEIMFQDANIGDRFEAFQDNLPVLTSNIRNALLMFNWKGDVGWINGVPNDPAMDPFTGALLILGAAGWLVLLVRRPDPVYALMPVMVIIMLLPSALSIAAPLENPSATRTSGALPPVYLITALPLALMAITVWQALRGRIFSAVVAVGLVVIVLGSAYADNRDTYLNEYRVSYNESWTSHSLPGRILRGFVLSEGNYGNAFMVGYQHWLDHRIIGAEAGVLDFVNGIADFGGRTAVERIPDFVNDAAYCTGPENPHRLDPNRDLLFFYHREDEAAAKRLQELFPDGQARFVQGERERDNFYMYRVPSLGEVEFAAWLAVYTENPRCNV